MRIFYAIFTVFGPRKLKICEIRIIIIVIGFGTEMFVTYTHTKCQTRIKKNDNKFNFLNAREQNLPIKKKNYLNKFHKNMLFKNKNVYGRKIYNFFSTVAIRFFVIF